MSKINLTNCRDEFFFARNLAVTASTARTARTMATTTTALSARPPSAVSVWLAGGITAISTLSTIAIIYRTCRDDGQEGSTTKVGGGVGLRLIGEIPLRMGSARGARTRYSTTGYPNPPTPTAATDALSPRRVPSRSIAVTGRLDHCAMDPKRKLLFQTCLGDDKVAVVDLFVSLSDHRLLAQPNEHWPTPLPALPALSAIHIPILPPPHHPLRLTPPHAVPIRPTAPYSAARRSDTSRTSRSPCLRAR